MQSSFATPDARFRWRTANIDVRRAAELYGPVETLGDSVETVRQALIELDHTLFADGFGPSRITCLTEPQLREWMHCVLRAWAQGVTEYLPQQCEPTAIHGEYWQDMLEHRQKVVDRNRPKFGLAWEALRALKIRSVFIEFSGAGDAGEIESIEPVFQDEPELVPTEEFAEPTANFRSKGISVPTIAVPVKLEDLIKDLSDDLLCFPEVPNWYNDEGGYGTLEWRLNSDGSNELQLTVNQYQLRTTNLRYNEFGFEFDSNQRQED